MARGSAVKAWTDAEVRDEAGTLLGHAHVPEDFGRQGNVYLFPLMQTVEFGWWQDSPPADLPAATTVDRVQFEVAFWCRGANHRRHYCLRADAVAVALLPRMSPNDFRPVTSGTPPQQPAAR